MSATVACASGDSGNTLAPSGERSSQILTVTPIAGSSSSAESVPTAPNEVAPTPVRSFSPTVGMLAKVPISRMSMDCWKKESEVGNRPRITYSCEARGESRALYVDVWGWNDLPETRVTVSFIYFEGVEPGLAELTQCDLIVVTRETTKKLRGAKLTGTCSRHAEPPQDAALRIDRAVNRWTASSGLARSIPRSVMDVIFDLLKR